MAIMPAKIELEGQKQIMKQLNTKYKTSRILLLFLVMCMTPFIIKIYERTLTVLGAYANYSPTIPAMPNNGRKEWW